MQSPQGVTVLVLLRGAPPSERLRALLDAAALPGLSLIDLQEDVQQLVADYRQRAMQAALLGTLETAFPNVGKFTADGLTVQIVRPMSAASPFIADGEVALPCSFRYSTDIVVA